MNNPDNVSGIGTSPYLDPNIVERGKSKIIEPYNGDANTVEVIGYLLDEIESVQDFIWSTIVDRIFCEGVTGVWLDYWGFIVGESRGSKTDDEFYQIISAKILANRSAGTVSETVEIARLAMGADALTYSLTKPMTYWLYVCVPEYLSEDMKADTKRLLGLATRVGVDFFVTEAKTDGYFGWLEDPDALGFDVGEWSGLI